MTKTPEEMTADWKAGKLPQWKFYYVSYSGSVEPLLLNGENDFINHSRIINSLVKSILAPVPPYAEYKAMQKELAELKEKIKKREELIQCLGSNIDELDVKKSVLIIENNKLRGLLKECLPIVSAEIMTWQIRGGEESHKRGQDLLTRINAALGDNEIQANPVDNIKIQESEE